MSQCKKQPRRNIWGSGTNTTGNLETIGYIGNFNLGKLERLILEELAKITLLTAQGY